MSEQFNRLRQLLSQGATSDMCLFYECNDDVIIIGGTRMQTFKMPLNVKYIKKLSIIYVQDDSIILKKTLNDLNVAKFDESLLYFKLSENDTMKFSKGKAAAQLKVLLEDGSILISNTLKINVIDTIDNSFFNNYSEDLDSLQITVSNLGIKLNQFIDIVANINNIYKCNFIFDSSWDSYEKYAVFRDEYNNKVNVKLVNDKCEIPSEVLSGPGNIYVGVTGVSGSFTRATTWSNSVRVLVSCNSEVIKTNNEKSVNEEESKEDDVINEDNIITISLSSLDGAESLLDFNLNSKGEF